MLTESIGEKTVIIPTAKHRNFPDGVFPECQQFTRPPQPDFNDHLPYRHIKYAAEKLRQIGRTNSGCCGNIRHRQIGAGIIYMDVIYRQLCGTAVIAELIFISPELPECQHQQ